MPRGALHRANLGSIELLIGILIEHYTGNLPLWLMPRQAVVATFTSDADGYPQEVHAALGAAGIQAELDLRNEKIGYTVREQPGSAPPSAVGLHHADFARRSRQPAAGRP